ncbi:MAG: LamG-like jellyroll fold domain-containing protein [Chitinophagaceae bacterium]
MNRLFTYLILLSNIASAQVDLSLGLKAYYPFSGNANDVSGNNNNPVFNNATLTADRFGIPSSAYNFNGTDTYMKILNSPSINMTNKMSITAWVKPTGFYTGTCYNNMMVMKGFNDNNQIGNYFIRFSDVYTGCTTPDITTERFYGGNTIAPLPIVQLNQWYSVIWTYDGITARIYINCELKFSTNIILNFTNSRDLFMGRMEDPSFPYWLNGVLDEVRIYDRPLNIDEVKAYGDCSLLTTAPNIGDIINDYTPVIGFNPCENKITVEDANAYNTGDTVLLIQMKGAVIDSTNTAAFGTVTGYKNAGNYEFNYVKSKTGNIIELKNTLTRQYDIPLGKVQLIRVPYYQNVNVTSVLTCLPWDGNKGGVLVLNVQDTLNLSSNIDVSGKGFRGGGDLVSNPSSFNCYENQFFYPVNPDLASEKGESIAIISSNKSYGKGSIANGGGSGNSHNSGGGGGSNFASGGFGGYNFEAGTCSVTVPFDNRGLGGKQLNYNNTQNKIFLGGGGGAGHSNNPQAFESKGGNGGGIAIIISDKIKSNGNKILANGNNGLPCGSNGSGCHEGMGGGGGGGTILINANLHLDNNQIEVKGGNGANMTAAGFLKVGPGGGGGAGLLWVSNAAIPSNINLTATGGLNGVCTGYSNNPWGATPGIAGSNLLNLQIPIDNTPFKPNIDSLRIKDSLLSCSNLDFKGFGFTNTNPISTWGWYFGDGATANTQNTTHTFAQGNYTVKLIITDINGCKDSSSKNIFASTLTMDAGPADTICAAGSSILQSSSIGATQYAWTPTAFLNDPTILNPTATPPVTTMFYLTATNASGCSSKDSVMISVRSVSNFSIVAVAPICTNKSVQLNANGGDVYSWQPASSLNNSNIYNPTASPTVTTTYSVLVTDTICGNAATLSTTVTVLPLPAVTASRSNDIDCSSSQSQLSASGASQYNWSPAATLNNPNSGSPIAIPVITTQYIVKGTNINGCINYDSVTVKVSADNKGGYLMPTAFTPNNDGKNDCYRVKYWGTILELEFSIYNRWGERIFFTRNPNDCWDGRYKGVQQDPAVFVYMIKAKTTCADEVFRKGTFVLIR